MIKEGLRQIREKFPEKAIICSAGTTCSARYLTGVIIGAGIFKNDIISQVIAALQYIPAAIGDIGETFLDQQEITLKDHGTKFEGFGTSEVKYRPLLLQMKNLPQSA